MSYFIGQVILEKLNLRMLQGHKTLVVLLSSVIIFLNFLLSIGGMEIEVLIVLMQVESSLL